MVKAIYAQFIKTKQNNFNGKITMQHMFKLIKDKGYEFKTFTLGEDNPQTFLTMKMNLFCDKVLVKNNIYYIWVEEEGVYLGHRYIRQIGIQNVPDTKTEKLLKKYNHAHPPQEFKQKLSVKVQELSDSDEDEEDEDEQSPEPVTPKLVKKRKNKTKRVKRRLKSNTQELSDVDN